MSSNPKVMIAIAKQVNQLITSPPDGKQIFQLNAFKANNFLTDIFRNPISPFYFRKL